MAGDHGGAARRSGGEGDGWSTLIVDEYDTTNVVRPGWRAGLDNWNNIVVERKD